jgi:hypothetical protein
MPDVDAMLEEMQSVLAGAGSRIDGSDPGLSCLEWAEAWGMEPGTARRRLKKLWTAGLIVSGKRRTTFMDGRTGSLPVYRPKP